MTISDLRKTDNFFLLAGPCVIEGEEMALRIADRIVKITDKLGIPYVFKGSYRKANRSRLDSFTGIGDEKALKVLRKVRETFGIPVVTDIHSAREGVLRLGSLLEKYGTYEMNGIAFSDHDEIWWLETIGGHHWIARRVPDDAYVVMTNQLGIDTFDLKDAFTTKENHLCSDDLKVFIEKNHLCLNLDDSFNARYAFGSHDVSDHVYYTPRDLFIRRYFNRNWCIILLVCTIQVIISYSIINNKL